jgi:flavin-dependent dehydrogenase
MNSFDVGVFGGGPAGLAVALALRRYSPLSVVVIEKGNYDCPRLGETLSPGISGLLQYLGVWESFQADGHPPSLGTSAAWGSSALAIRDFILTPFGTGWHLDRCRFDQNLARHAEAAGAFVLRLARGGCERRPGGGWRLDVQQGRIRRKLEVRFLVDSTGKCASVARQVGAKRQILDRMVAVAATVELPHPVPIDTLTLVETCELGWWYSSRLPTAQMIVVLMTDIDLMRTRGWSAPESWWRFLRAQHHTWDRVKKGHLAGHPSIIPAFSARLDRVVGGDWMAVGDAAATYDPLSSSGIARAIDSGVNAARAIYTYLQSGRGAALIDYDRRRRESFEIYWETRQRYYDMERRWPQSPFWRRRRRLVTLDPHSRIELAKDAVETISNLSLPTQPREIDQQLLFRLCAIARPAHEVVAEFQRQSMNAVPELAVVLALESWLQSGIVRVIATRQELGTPA